MCSLCGYVLPFSTTLALHIATKVHIITMGPSTMFIQFHGKESSDVLECNACHGRQVILRGINMGGGDLERVISLHKLRLGHFLRAADRILV